MNEWPQVFSPISLSASYERHLSCHWRDLLVVAGGIVTGVEVVDVPCRHKVAG